MMLGQVSVTRKGKWEGQGRGLESSENSSSDSVVSP